MYEHIEKHLLSAESTIKEAMLKMNIGGRKIAIVINGDRKLLGTVSDGDIRRALLGEHTLESSIKKIMNKHPIYANEDTSSSEIINMMQENVLNQVPIVNSDNQVIEIYFIHDFRNIPLSNPDITHKEINLINEVLNTSSLSIGPKIIEFEDEIANYIGTNFAVGVNSGTSALHLCMKSFDIKDGDEVITTPFSFIASANCILFERAKPVFVDIDEDSLCINIDLIEKKITGKTKAILPVHVFGHPCEMDDMLALSSKHNLLIIEDACEAIGTEYKGKKTGSFGDVGVFAFYPNKQITTAEGGMIVTNDERISSLCKSMRNQGRDETDEWLAFKRLGYNYRMNELSAAMGIIQLGRIDEIVDKRISIAAQYNERLKDIEDIRLPSFPPNGKMSWFVYVIRLNYEKFPRFARDDIIVELKKRGIFCSNYFTPIHLQPLYVDSFGYKIGDFPVTERVSGTTIALPFFNNINISQIDYICDSLKNILQKK